VQFADGAAREILRAARAGGRVDGCEEFAEGFDCVLGFDNRRHYEKGLAGMMSERVVCGEK